MRRAKRFLQCCGFAAAVAMLIAATGCQTSTCTVLPSGVELPRGFHPLKGHADFGDPADNYSGWPRFIFSEQDRMVMVYVPTQTVTVGGGCGPDEVPARQVVVNHFYVDLHEVSNVQFDCFRRTARHHDVDCSTGRCGEAECEPCGSCPLLSSGRCCDQTSDTTWIENELCYPGRCFSPWEHRDMRPGQSCRYRDYWTPCVNNNHPARNVSWREAWMYGQWACKRLPSEAQWEAAARGDDQRVYPWGNQETVETTRYLCNHRTSRDDYDGYEYTAPVLAYAAGVSPYGAFNMAGNVWEWCGDWYDPGRYAYPSDEDPATGLERGPKPFGDRYYPNPWDKDIPEARVGPMRGSERVLRGGSFADPIQRCRVDSRWSAGQEVHLNNVGFRCVLPLPPQT